MSCRHDYLVGRSQAYRRDPYRNSRHSGAISLSIVCGSMVLALGQFCRQISIESYYRVGLQAYRRKAYCDNIFNRDLKRQ